MPEIFDSGIISIQITRWQLKSTQPHFLFQNRTAVNLLKSQALIKKVIGRKRV
mgnify:CR=1 FL=1